MRRITLIATIVAMTWFLAIPAFAKGPAKATISGPGIEEPIELFSRQPYTSEAQENLNKLMEMSGIWFASHLAVKIDQPSDLGEPITLTWGEPYSIEQHIYFGAKDGPVIHTPKQPGLDGWGGDAIGWHRVEGDLEGTLEALGFSYSSTQPKPEWNLPFGLLAIIGVASITYLIFRNQPRTRHVALEIGELR